MDSDRPGWNPPATHHTPGHSADVPLSAPAEVSSTPRRARVGTGIAIAAVAVGALGLAGTAYAANSSTPSPAPSGSGGYGAPGQPGQAPAGQAPQGQAPGGMGGRGHGDMGPGRGRMGLGAGIHGTFVTPKQGGGYQTVDTQRGAVTAVSSTSITVKSEDGFTKTYVVTADTIVNAKRDGIGSIKVKDTVSVVAIESAGSAKAVSIMDGTQVKDGWQRVAPPRPTPTSSSSSSTA